jgi:hypothetical protein
LSKFVVSVRWPGGSHGHVLVGANVVDMINRVATRTCMLLLGKKGSSNYAPTALMHSSFDGNDALLGAVTGMKPCGIEACFETMTNPPLVDTV